VGASLILPGLLPRLMNVSGFLERHSVNLGITLIFPMVLVISLIGCVLGTLLTKPTEDEVLKTFYRRVRPWGFWGPVLKKVREENPGFQPNRDFWWDAFNVIVGICWQVSLVALPIYTVIRKFDSALACFAVVAVTSVVLKFTWYERLVKEEALLARQADKQPEVSATTA
jgi:hypothetical protein